MSDSADKPQDPDAVEQALARFLEGEPEPGDGAILAEAIKRDPAFAAEVRRLLHVDDLLRQAHEFDDGAFADAILTRLDTEEDGDAFTQSVAKQIPDAAPLAELAKPAPTPPKKRSGWRFAIAAGLLLAVAGLGLRMAFSPRTEVSGQDVARLVNAQDCRWVDGGEPTGPLSVGKTLQLQSGLAELSFTGGASVVLQGPASLELLSGNSARLVRGRLSARVPEAAQGFTILSPEGKVVDLGTEFGMDVAEDGSAEVVVFRGEVRAERDGAPVSVREAQAVRIGSAGVVFSPAADTGRYVRAIVPPPVIVPRTLKLDFRKSVVGTVTDKSGHGIGFTHRLPGTGGTLPQHDPNLQLLPEAGRLRLTTTQSDLNGQETLGRGEYVGIRLADLGFTGKEDFAVTAEFSNAPALEEVDQFGLYAGPRSDCHIRGGLIRPGGRRGIGDSTEFFVQNDGGADANLSMIGLVRPGNKIAMTLRRVGGKYSFSIEDRATAVVTELSIRHPEFLDREKDLHVGLFGATPWRMYPRTIVVEKFTATVWVRN
jgi:hypothetical protein